MKCAICGHKFTCSTLYNVKKYVFYETCVLCFYVVFNMCLRKSNNKLYAFEGIKITPSKNYLSKIIIKFQKVYQCNFKCSFGKSFVCIQAMKRKQFSINVTVIWQRANGMKIALVTGHLRVKQRFHIII